MTDKESQKIQMEKMFNTAECVLKEWIAKFLNKPAREIFDVVPDVVEPVLFYPSELSNGKYVEFKLGEVDSKYSENIDALIGEKLVRDTIQFFIYSVKVVYGSIMKTTSRNAAHDVVLEWDSQTMTFIPLYVPDPKKKIIFFNHVLSCMMNAKKTLPSDQEERWEEDFKKLMDDIRENQGVIESGKIDEEVDAKNLEWVDLHRVGVLVRYIDESEIPHDIRLKNIKSVSDIKYIDPPDDKEEVSSSTANFSDVVSKMSQKLLKDLNEIEFASDASVQVDSDANV